jgi:hypothetical protein
MIVVVVDKVASVSVLATHVLLEVIALFCLVLHVCLIVFE